LDPFRKREAATDAKTGRQEKKNNLASLRFQRAVEQELSFKKR